eukprot:622204-Pyramimonas_sp.AAC.1
MRFLYPPHTAALMPASPARPLAEQRGARQGGLQTRRRIIGLVGVWVMVLAAALASMWSLTLRLGPNGEALDWCVRTTTSCYYLKYSNTHSKEASCALR